MTALGVLDDFRQDARYALRSLARNPGFATVAVLTLALGIGANTAIFSVVYAVLLKPLPYEDPGRLVRITQTLPAAESANGRPARSSTISVPELVELRSRSRTLSHIAINGGPAIVTLSGRGEATRLQGMRVAPGIFETLGVRPLIGRGFGATEEAPGADGVIVLSYPAWRRYFAADPEILGQTLTLTNNLTPVPQASSKEYTVVGVMPEGFEYADGQIQFWIPSSWTATGRGSMIARLADEVSTLAAAAEIGTILRELRKPAPGTSYEISFIQDDLFEPIRPALVVLMAAAGLVLLVACLNVANLLFARAETRQREIGIRLALGAGRFRVARDLLSEGVLLALGGGVAGTLLAFGGVRLLKVLTATLVRMDLGVQLPFPRLEEIGLGVPVLLYVFGSSMLTGVLLAVGPAVVHSRSGRFTWLRDSASTGYSGFRFRGVRSKALLVIVEISMAMMLLVAGALLIQSFMKLSAVRLGFDPGSVHTFQVAVPPERYTLARIRALADDLVARLQAAPGVQAAAYGQLPFVALTESARFRRTPDVPERPRPGSPEIRLVSRDYLRVMGIRVVSGRGFDERDREGSPRVLLVNQTVARAEFPGDSPIGQRVFAGDDAAPWEIVGAVEDVRQTGVDLEPGPQVFAVVGQWPGGAVFPLGPYFSVRTESSPAAVVSLVRRTVGEIDDQAGLFNVATMEQVVSNRLTRPRLYAVLLGIFAGVAAVLAGIGVYGVMAYAVAQRTREIGIRMAIGARQSQVMTLVLGQSVAVTAIGMMLGVAGAMALSRYLQSLLFGLTPLDPGTFIAVAILFAAVAGLAAVVPARRATKVDPMVALRCD